jgi:hypothetical protein
MDRLQVRVDNEQPMIGVAKHFPLREKVVIARDITGRGGTTRVKNPTER